LIIEKGSKSKMKIITVIGARPQFVKAAPVSAALAAAGIAEKIIHTGQHHDTNMSNVFFEELGIPEPAYNLGIQGGGHGAMTGQMLESIEGVLLKELPDVVLVYGDTNSTLAGALAAVKLHIPVVHVEAGLRSFNREMPEEINRIMVDHVSDLLLCTSSSAVGILANEGIVKGVHNVGDVMFDINLKTRSELGDPQKILQKYEVAERKYSLVTWHRAENTDCNERLQGIGNALNSIEGEVLLPLHPRTRKALERQSFELGENVKTIDPVSYHEMVALILGARRVLTDSGGVQKEAYWCGVPCITMRDETEWTETVEVGWNKLVGATTEDILEAVHTFQPSGEILPLYGEGKAAQEIARILLSELGAV